MPIVCFEYKNPRDGAFLLSISRGIDNKFPWRVESDPDGSILKQLLHRSPHRDSPLCDPSRVDDFEIDGGPDFGGPDFDGISLQGGVGGGFGGVGYGAIENPLQGLPGPLPYHGGGPPFPGGPFRGPFLNNPFLPSYTSLSNLPQHPLHNFSNQRPGLLGESPDSLPPTKGSPFLSVESPNRGGLRPPKIIQERRGGQRPGREVNEKKSPPEKEKIVPKPKRPSFLLDFEGTIEETVKETVSSAAAVKDPRSVEHVMKEVLFDLVSSVYEDTKKQCADAIIASHYHAWNAERLKPLSLGTKPSQRFDFVLFCFVLFFIFKSLSLYSFSSSQTRKTS